MQSYFHELLQTSQSCELAAVAGLETVNKRKFYVSKNQSQVAHQNQTLLVLPQGKAEHVNRIKSEQHPRTHSAPRSALFITFQTIGSVKKKLEASLIGRKNHEFLDQVRRLVKCYA